MAEALHKFTTNQLIKLTAAITWPRITDDPRINYAIDCMREDNGGDDEPYNADLYEAEVRVSSAKLAE